MDTIMRLFKPSKNSRKLDVNPTPSSTTNKKSTSLDDEDFVIPPHLNFDLSRTKDRMSVSRSGRYKQKGKKRSCIYDNPELLGTGGPANSQEGTCSNTMPQQQGTGNSAAGAGRRDSQDKSDSHYVPKPLGNNNGYTSAPGVGNQNSGEWNVHNINNSRSIYNQAW